MPTSPTVLFLAHGSPLFAIEAGAAGAALQSLARELARPRALLLISPHWETKLPTVGTTEAAAGNRLETIHDFGGFDPRLYEIQVPASGSPEAAREVVEALQNADLPVSNDPPVAGWTTAPGCHCASSSLRRMCRWCPCRSSTTASRGQAYREGQALAPLAEQGWLIAYLASSPLAAGQLHWRGTGSAVTLITESHPYAQLMLPYRGWGVWRVERSGLD